MDSFKLASDRDFGPIFAAFDLAVGPVPAIVIHRRKCKVRAIGRCTCRPTFIMPPARA